MVFELQDRVKAQGVALTVTEVDITTHPDVVHQYKILTTPAIAIDGQLVFRGAPTERQLLAHVRKQGLIAVDTPAPAAAPQGFLGRLRGLFR